MTLIKNKLRNYRRLNTAINSKKSFNLKNDKYWLKAALILGAVPVLGPVTQIQAQCIGTTPLNSSAVPDNSDAGLTVDLDGGGADFRFVEKNANEGTLYIQGIGGAQVLGLYFPSYPATVVPNNYAPGAIIKAPTGGNAARDNGFLFYSNGGGPWGTGTTTGYIGIVKGGAYGFIEITITATLITLPEYDFFITVGPNSGFDVGVPGDVQAGDCATLPVEIVDFKSQLIKNNIVLDWSTSSEVDNAGFQIERSKDAVNFKPISFMEGHGNSSRLQNYKYVDKNIKENVTYYYRLKQVDYNGRFEYSEMVSVENKGSKTGVGDIYPNPVINNELSIKIDSEINQNSKGEIFNISGQLLKTINIELSEGKNIVTIETAEIGDGIYYLKLTKEEKAHYRKFIIE